MTKCYHLDEYGFCSLDITPSHTRECPCPSYYNPDDSQNLVQQDKPDMVNQPPHYTQGDVECIDAIKAATTGKPPYQAWLVGQVIKYLWRYNFKNGLEDVKKAEFYLKKLIEEVSNGSSGEA